MPIWQIQTAKAKLTQLLKEARLTPQIISRHGVKETVVMSIDHYEKLIGKKENLVSFFKKSPLYGVQLDCDRDKSTGRDIDL